MIRKEIDDFFKSKQRRLSIQIVFDVEQDFIWLTLDNII
jgi:hypothetical protein